MKLFPRRRRRHALDLLSSRGRGAKPAARSRVGLLVNRYGLGMGVEQLEDRRMLAAGGLDPTFNAGAVDGIIVQGFAPTNIEGNAVVVQADGKTLIAGTYGSGGSNNFAVVRLNVDGSLDTSFGNEAAGDLDGTPGLATADFGLQDEARDVVIDASGRIVVVGRGQQGSSPFASGIAIARFDANGDLDTTLAGDGTALHIATNLGSIPVFSEGRGVAIDGAGNILVAGVVSNLLGTGNDFLLARFTSSGAADATFGVGASDVAIGAGMVATHFGGSDEAFDIAIDDLGQIVAAGTANSVFALARYNANGTLDTSFSGDGKQTTDVLLQNTDVIHSIAFQADDRIVVAGESFSGLPTGDVVVARYNADGSLDTSGFNTGGPQPGLFSYSPGVTASHWDGGRGLAIQGNGTILVAGFADFGGSTNSKAVALRLTGVGALDASFGTGGVTITDVDPTPGVTDQLRDGVITPDGKFVAVGLSGSNILAIRYDLGQVEVDAGGPYVINEPGGTITLNGTATASGTLTFQWDFDNDGFYDDAVGTNPSFTATGVDGPATLTIGLRVSIDSNNDTIEDDAATDTATVNIVNTPPTLTISGAADVNEGATYTLNLSSFDPGADTITSWTIHWGNAIEVVSGNPASVTHTYFDGDASHIITATATDEDGTYSSNQVPITVHNVAPTLTLSGAATVAEGSSYTLNLSATDPGIDTITSWNINWGDSIEFVGGNPASVTHTYADGDANYTISATATDEDGTHAGANTVDVTVENVAPTLAISGASMVSEGSTYTLNLSSSDLGDDTITSWTIDWGDEVEVVTGNPASATHTYADGDASYLISASATDEDGTFAAGNTVAVNVDNVDPTLAISGPADVDEGSVYTLNLSSSDPGADAITSWEINWGDSIEVVSGNPASVTHTYADGDAGYTISATATDEDGAYAAAATVAVLVHNVDPTANSGGPYSVDEGSSVTLNGSATDPAGSKDVLAFTWDLDNNGSFETAGANPTFSAVGLDGPGTHTIHLRVTDEDGGEDFVTTTVTVANVAPAVDAGGPYATFDDTPITLQGSATDPAGAADPLTFTWDLDGDNVFGETGAGAMRGDEVGATPTFNPIGLSAGTYNVALRVSDGDLGVTTDTTTVQVLTQGTLLIGDELHIVGGNCNDVVFISQCGGSIIVLATFNSSNPVVVNAADVDEIKVRTRGGNDIVLTAPNVIRKMTIDGGSGNDLLVGGSARNVILGGTGSDSLHGGVGDDVLLGGDGDDDLFGGDGNDVLVGGKGNDILRGGNGRDFLVGGLDNDDLEGGADDDIVVGGYTIHDNNVAALDSIMAVWTSAASFNSRVATLTAPGGLLQGGVAVFDDNDQDDLNGNSGRDLYFADMSKSGDGVKDTVSFQSTLDALVAVN